MASKVRNRGAERFRKRLKDRMRGVLPKEQRRGPLSAVWAGGRWVLCRVCGKAAGYRTPAELRQYGDLCKEHLHVDHPKCDVCGEWLQPRNMYGVCNRALRCHNEYTRRYREVHPPRRRPLTAEQREAARQRERRRRPPRGPLRLTAQRRCELCGEGIQDRNEYGVCSRNTGCKKEYRRRRDVAIKTHKELEYEERRKAS
ncbi:MAG: hypothetical protein ACYTBJ_26605 [Planctomycetota bacterium]